MPKIEKSSPKNMNLTRRVVRVVPDKLAFIQLDQDEWGRALNISEEGLGFEASAPMHQERQLRFWFSLDLSDRIEAVGEVAWTDVTGKIGGLKFLELSPDARGQIRNWIQQNSEHTGIAAESSRFEVLRSPAPSDTTELVPLGRHRAAVRRQLIQGVFLGILISCAVTIPAVKYFKASKTIGSLQPASPQEMRTNSVPQGGTPISGSDANRSSTAASVSRKTQQAIPASHLPDNPLASKAGNHRQGALEVSVENASLLSVAQSQPHGTKSLKKIVASPQRLWSAVQGGSTQAALTLAGLYLRGDGVPANCDQARVLLLVASEKRNAQAIQELRELDKTGCPTPAQ